MAKFRLFEMALKKHKIHMSEAKLIHYRTRTRGWDPLFVQNPLKIKVQKKVCRGFFAKPILSAKSLQTAKSMPMKLSLVKRKCLHFTFCTRNKHSFSFCVDLYQKPTHTTNRCVRTRT